MRMTPIALVGLIILVLGVPLAQAQTAGAAAAGTAASAPPMTFFITSVSPGSGGNLGGLAGADAHCQSLAESTGISEVAAKIWHAYLSASPSDGQPGVDARSRIGTGPWHNAKGALIATSVGELHGDTLEAARLGNRINMRSALDEKGRPVNAVGGPTPLRHDILTGTKPDGTAYADAADRTCRNWTSGKDGMAQVGHHDRTGYDNASWNSAHASSGCSPEQLQATGSGGLFYCFAIN